MSFSIRRANHRQKQPAMFKRWVIPAAVAILALAGSLSLNAAVETANYLLESRKTPLEAVMLNGTTALPASLAAASSNPAHLSPLKMLDFNAAAGQAPFESGHYYGTVLYYIPAYRLPVQIEAGATRIETGEFYDNYGNPQYSQVYSNMFSAGSAVPLKFAGRPFRLGGRLKYAGQSLGSGPMHYVLADAGLWTPFRVDALRLKSSKAIENFSAGLSFNNFGPPASCSRQTSCLAPASLTAGLASRFFYRPDHELDLAAGISVFPYNRSFGDELSLSFSAAYTFFDYFKVRAGLLHQNTITRPVAGWGIEYNKTNAYRLAVDYSATAEYQFQFSHMVSLQASYNIYSSSGRIMARSRDLSLERRDLNAELLTVVKRGIERYSLHEGHFPAHLPAIEPFLKKDGFESLPRPQGAMFSYDATTGVVLLVDKQITDKYSDMLVLKDGSSIRCNVVSETGSSLKCNHQYGQSIIDKNSIARRWSAAIRNIDQQVVITLQDYIQKYHTARGTYPRDLNELEKFIHDRYPEVSFPRLWEGQLEYNPDNGRVSSTAAGQNAQKTPGMAGAPEQAVAVKKLTVKPAVKKQAGHQRQPPSAGRTSPVQPGSNSDLSFE